MRAVFIKGRGEVEVRKVPVPRIGPKEILVKMEACGICGTDIEKVKGEFVTPPKLGHEVAGVVAEAGRNVEGLEEGDRVFVHHHVPCYKCHYCRHGDHTMCDEFPRSNLDPCGMADYFRVPEANVERGAVLKLPEGVGFEEATLIEPLACCIRGLNKVPIEPGDDALVVGAGPAGLMMLALLRAKGVGSLLASEVSPPRLAAAKEFGADLAVNPLEGDLGEAVNSVTDGRGVDLAVVAVGSAKVASQTLGLVRKGGWLLLFGAPPPGDALSYDASKLFIRELKIVPSYSTTEAETNAALKLLRLGGLKVSRLISHRFKLEEAGRAFEAAMAGGEALKVIVRP